jgi:hypothetical protein
MTALAPRCRDLFPSYRANHRRVERPDVVQRLHPVSAAEYPDLALIEHGGVRAARQRSACRHERRVRPTARRNVKDVYAVVVWYALAATDDDDDDDLASYESRRVRAAWR